MRTSKLIRITACALAGLLYGALAVGSAYAAGPTTVPADVRALQSFETSPVTGWDIRAFNLVPPATASWGISGLKYSLGVKSLWCAGTAAGTTYPGGTAGYAQMNLGELSEYYSSSLHFKYVMPSVGMSDANSFNVGWSDNGTRVQPNYGFPLTSTWQQLVFDMSDPADFVSISRESGYAYFQFIDFSEGPNQTVKTGQGAFVDEVVVKGYKYGKVRSLSATSAAGVQLSWSAPYASRAHTTIEARPIVYRVWRTLDNGQTPTWVELTAQQGTSATSYLDSSAVAGVSYIYALQVWDNNAQRGYGEALEVVGRLASPTLDLSISAPDAVKKNDSAAITYYVTNTSGAVIGPVGLQDSAGTVLAQIPTIAVGATVSQSFSLGPLAATRSLTATATAGAIAVAATRQITVVDPKLTVAVSPSAASVEQGVGFSVDYTVTNTGDIDLKDVVIRDETSATVGLIPLLTTSGPVTLTVNYTAQSTRTFGASAAGGWAYLSASGQVFANAAGATVTVTGIQPPPTRIAGATRTATAVELSKEAFPDPLDGDRAVVIASAYGWADALPASALAGVIDGPLLLVAKDSVPAEVATEISRLGATKAYIVGGEAVVAAPVRTELQNRGLTVERVSGANRYATSEQIALKVQSLDPDAASIVFVATGMNFPDALAASSIAAKTHHPILLTPKEALPLEGKRALDALNPTSAYVLGGTGAISSAVQTDLNMNYAPFVYRLDGATRYDTALSIINAGKTLTGSFPPAGIFLATGTNFPDALAGGVLAGIGDTTWRPLMLTTPTALGSQAATFINANSSVKFASVIGGAAAVSEVVLTQANQLLQ